MENKSKYNKFLECFFIGIDFLLLVGMTFLIVLCLCAGKECKTDLLIGFGISLLAFVLAIMMHLIVFTKLFKASKRDIYADGTLDLIIENKVNEFLKKNNK